MEEEKNAQTQEEAQKDEAEIEIGRRDFVLNFVYVAEWSIEAIRTLLLAFSSWELLCSTPIFN